MAILYNDLRLCEFHGICERLEPLFDRAASRDGRIEGYMEQQTLSIQLQSGAL